MLVCAWFCRNDDQIMQMVFMNCLEPMVPKHWNSLLLLSSSSSSRSLIHFTVVSCISNAKEEGIWAKAGARGGGTRGL